MLFEQDANDEHTTFEIIAVVILALYNSLFIVEWTYMFLLSLDLKSSKMQLILQIIASILFQRHDFDVSEEEKKLQKEKEEKEEKEETDKPENVTDKNICIAKKKKRFKQRRHASKNKNSTSYKRESKNLLNNNYIYR